MFNLHKGMGKHWRSTPLHKHMSFQARFEDEDEQKMHQDSHHRNVWSRRRVHEYCLIPPTSDLPSLRLLSAEHPVSRFSNTRTRYCPPGIFCAWYLETYYSRRNGGLDDNGGRSPRQVDQGHWNNISNGHRQWPILLEIKTCLTCLNNGGSASVVVFE